MKYIHKIAGGLILSTAFVLVAVPPASAATVVIQNNDAPNVGFNDPTSAAPIGGNNGTTVGQQRMIALQRAADIWGSTLISGPTITINATWEALECTANGGVLASASALTFHRDFSNAPFSGTWYVASLANKLRGNDLNTASSEIRARFNLSLGSAGCLTGSFWYYGLDGNDGAGADLVAVALHEFAHGLGFLTSTNASTGAQLLGSPNIYDFFLVDSTTGKTWVQMTDSERVASAINTGNLVWNGSKVKTAAPNILASPRVRVNSPLVIAGNYQPGTAEFGSPLSSPGVTSTLVQAFDQSDADGPSTTDGCSTLTNSASIVGNIALIDRGTCTFVSKAKNAQNAGAVAVIIVDNQSASQPPGMAGSDPTLTIPVVSVTLADGNTFKTHLGAGVNVTIYLDGSTPSGIDAGGRLRMYSPNPFQGGSSVAHWDVSLFPNQLMEPNISGELTHSVDLPQDLTFSLFHDLGWTIETGNTVQLDNAAYAVSESGGSLRVNVIRSDTSGAATVNYSTSDTLTIDKTCVDILGIASSRCDYATSVGTVRFAPGEASKAVFIPIVDDAYAEGAETFSIALSSPVGIALGAVNTANITINDNETANGANPLDTNAFFVRQHYIDFLGREPEPAGLDGWLNVLNNCGVTVALPCDRIEVSAGFFRSPEFQARGYFIYRFFSAVGRIPLYPEFMPDFAKVSGFLSDAQLEANKAAFVNEYIARAEFQTKYSSTFGNPTAYVDALLQTVGLPSHPSRQTWINQLTANNTSQVRGEVLRALVESQQVYDKYYNEAFVIMQYFGYLRRTADASYLDWINTMNQTGGDYRIMINGFMNSAEYRRRFGP
jgi:hypothetical protein